MRIGSVHPSGQSATRNCSCISLWTSSCRNRRSDFTNSHRRCVSQDRESSSVKVHSRPRTMRESVHFTDIRRPTPGAGLARLLCKVLVSQGLHRREYIVAMLVPVRGKRTFFFCHRPIWMLNDPGMEQLFWERTVFWFSFSGNSFADHSPTTFTRQSGHFSNLLN